MAPGSCVCQSPYVNILADPAGELNELAGTQGLAKRSNIRINEALTPPEASILLLVSPPTEKLFTRFIKVFIEMTQVQALAELQERLVKTKTPETYSGKSHRNCYHFCQQWEDYFKTSDTTGMNYTPFAAIFSYSIVSLKWAQHKRRHKNATLTMWSDFKIFLQKNFGNLQAFINSIWSQFRIDS